MSTPLGPNLVPRSLTRHLRSIAVATAAQFAWHDIYMEPRYNLPTKRSSPGEKSHRKRDNVRRVANSGGG